MLELLNRVDFNSWNRNPIRQLVYAKYCRQYLYFSFNLENSYIIFFLNRFNFKHKFNTNIISKFNSKIFYIF